MNVFFARITFYWQHQEPEPKLSCTHTQKSIITVGGADKFHVEQLGSLGRVGKAPPVFDEVSVPAQILLLPLRVPLA